MTIKKINLNNLVSFKEDDSYLSIVERPTPKGANVFFKELLDHSLNINITVSKKLAFTDIRNSLDHVLSSNIQENLFYNFWIKDMSCVTKIFANIIKETKVCFSLETLRGCRRYHIDNVPMRLLVTYYGKGTEWLPPSACNYLAYYNGEKNEKIIKDKSKKKFLNSWDIAIFKGKKFIDGDRGILHRTPDAALGKQSLLMRIDHHKFIS